MATEKIFYIYILARKRNGTIYIGITSDLEQRIWERKHDVYEGFTKRRKVHLLIYYEDGGDALNAIVKEKQMKKWCRAWKIRLIEKHNPRWIDLYNEEEGILPLPLE